jgi:hypothetical protein
MDRAWTHPVSTRHAKQEYDRNTTKEFQAVTFSLVAHFPAILRRQLAAGQLRVKTNPFQVPVDFFLEGSAAASDGWALISADIAPSHLCSAIQGTLNEKAMVLGVGFHLGLHTAATLWSESRSRRLSR